MVYLATDPDREGEAIAWHLQEALGLPDERVRRVIFHEITEKAVKEAFDHVGPIDMDKVNAQQARRFLDRFVGYQLSPLLWKKVARHLSAGRVQSVAVRLIADREKEIQAFVSEEYWKITAMLSPEGHRRQGRRRRTDPNPPGQPPRTRPTRTPRRQRPALPEAPSRPSWPSGRARSSRPRTRPTPAPIRDALAAADVRRRQGRGSREARQAPTPRSRPARSSSRRRSGSGSPASGR